MDIFLRMHGIAVDEFNEIAQSSNTDYHNRPIPVLMQPTIPESLISQMVKYNLKNGTSYGFNIASSLSLVQNKKKNKGDEKYKGQFQLARNGAGEEYLKSIFEMIISSNPMENCIMKEVENTQSNYNSRKSDVDNPKLCLMFLPLNGDIDKLQKTVIKFLEKHNLWTDYHVTYSNSKSKLDEDEKEYKKFVNKQMETTKSKNKKGCILLLGHQGKMAYTYHECDVVIRLDNGTDIDDAEQVGYRCLTEGPITDNVDEQKKIGIVVDLNIQRVYNVMRNKIKEYKKDNPESGLKYHEIIQYMYEEKQFIFNPNEFDFGNCTDEMIEYYKKYEDNLKSETLIETVTCNIQVNGDPLSELIKQIKMKDGTYQSNEKLNGKQPEVTKGDKTKKKADTIKGDDVQVFNADEDKNEDNEPEIDVFKDINKTKNLYEFLSKLSCLMLRLDYKNPNITNNVIDLLKTLKENEKRFNIIKMKLIDDYSIGDENLKEIYDIYINDMNNQNNIDILDDIFEIYANSKPEVVREIIGKHFIPSLDQKKKNAEIPTPPKLCGEMIDKIPKEYFTNKNNKTLEPCPGKGNLVLAIFEAYFEGLSHIEDECERCIVIIEECLYFCDIDPMNIYITEELLKCHALSKMKEECWKDWDNVLKICDVKFNSYVGDTLKLDTKKEWGVKGFDAVIGNPPYENRNKRGDNSLYMDFTVWSLEKLMRNGYLLFITPKLILDNLLRVDINRKRIDKLYNIHYLAIDTPKKYFQNIGTNFVYFLLQNNTNNITKTKIEYIYNKKVYKSEILLVEGMNLPNIYDPNGINIIDKVTNKITNNKDKKLLSEDIQKCKYKHKKYHMQRIRASHFIDNTVKTEETEEYKYPMIQDGFSRKKYPFPGGLCYYTHPMEDLNKSKIIITNIGFEIGYDGDGKYNLSDSLSYIIASKEEYELFKNLTTSKLINFILLYYKNNTQHDMNKLFNKNLYYIPFNEMKSDADIYKHFNLTDEEIKLVENTV
jgi:hypothetical protein